MEHGQYDYADNAKLDMVREVQGTSEHCHPNREGEPPGAPEHDLLPNSPAHQGPGHVTEIGPDKAHDASFPSQERSPHRDHMDSAAGQAGTKDLAPHVQQEPSQPPAQHHAGPNSPHKPGKDPREVGEPIKEHTASVATQARWGRPDPSHHQDNAERAIGN
jgi:hypothetical protein